jgi:hypothetical protein
VQSIFQFLDIAQENSDTSVFSVIDTYLPLMSQLLAPYNESMSLGQGFNSYTQQVCLDTAVSIDREYKSEPQPELGPHIASANNGDAVADPSANERGKGTPIKRFSWAKPQIVSYTSHFVDKLSDVTGE